MLEITDALGRTIIRHTMEAPVVKLSTGQLAAGVYLVKIADSSGRMVVKKLVKE